jgi:CRP-like cAMP-binding protein
MPEDALQEQVEDLIEDLFLPPQGPLATAGPRSPAPPGEGGLAGLIFDEMAPEERLALMRGLRLRTYEPGDILVTEGEPPSGLYLVTAGGLRLHARDALGRNQEAGALQEGDFFGEVASLSGLPRHVTAVATAPGEMLVLDQDSMDQIALNHPRVWARMHAYARERAAGRKAAAPGEALAEGPGSEPRLRLRLVKAFLRAGKREEARRILLDLADELVRQGRSETAVALLRKIEQLGASAAGAGPAPPSSPPSGRVGSPVATDDQLGSWIKSLARDAPAHPEASRREPRRWVERLADPETLRAQAGLRGCRLFEGLGEEALLGFVQDLPLEERGAGEILLTEGEPSDSLLVVATGRVKVFVRQRSGRDGLLLELGEGAFLGEIGVLAGLPRTATATTAAPTLLLRVDRRSLERLCRSHPPARAVLEEALQARSTNPEESPVRDRTEHE